MKKFECHLDEIEINQATDGTIFFNLQEYQGVYASTVIPKEQAKALGEYLIELSKENDK